MTYKELMKLDLKECMKYTKIIETVCDNLLKNKVILKKSLMSACDNTDMKRIMLEYYDFENSLTPDGYRRHNPEYVRELYHKILVEALRGCAILISEEYINKELTKLTKGDNNVI